MKCRKIDFIADGLSYFQKKYNFYFFVFIQLVDNI